MIFIQVLEGLGTGRFKSLEQPIDNFLYDFSRLRDHLSASEILLMGAQDPDYLNMIFSKAVEKLENPSATIMIE